MGSEFMGVVERVHAWLVKTNPYQEELSGVLCGRELETGSASGCFSVNNFIYISF